MKRLCLSPKSQTKKGVASLYIVIFATLLFGVITVSFARIILSEATQSSNDDLSRSAYDAALAGVEDAKTFVNRYFNCIKNNSESQCTNFDIFTDKYTINNGTYTEDSSTWNCDGKKGFPLSEKMGFGGKEVLIQEGNTQEGTEQGEFTDQAYTCVLVSDIIPDYRGTLSKDTRTKVIPLGINRNDGTGSNLGNVSKVEFSWYSDMNRGSNTKDGDFKNLNHGGYFDNKSKATVPPTIQLSYIKFNSSTNINTTYHTDNTGANYSTMVFLPTNSDSLASGKTMLGQNTINYSELKNAGDVRKTVNGHEESMVHEPYLVSCDNGAEFACGVTIEISDASNPLTDNDTAFLVASLPYGDAYTDFAVTLYDKEGKTVYLKGVQISVDSTGRTNQLVRRVEARLDPADLFFPYPQFALELSGDDEDSLKKNFWVTTNCWYSNPSENKIGTCENNGDVGTSSGF